MGNTNAAANALLELLANIKEKQKLDYASAFHRRHVETQLRLITRKLPSMHVQGAKFFDSLPVGVMYNFPYHQVHPTIPPNSKVLWFETIKEKTFEFLRKEASELNEEASKKYVDHFLSNVAFSSPAEFKKNDTFFLEQKFRIPYLVDVSHADFGSYTYYLKVLGTNGFDGYLAFRDATTLFSSTSFFQDVYYTPEMLANLRPGINKRAKFLPLYLPGSSV